MHAVGILGQAVGEHLHLGELVHAVQPLGELSRGSGLATEAVRDAGQPEGQGRLVQDLAGMVAAQGDLGGADQAGALALDGVDVGLRAAGIEADALEDLGLGYVRRDEGGEALLLQDVQGEADQGKLQEHALVLQVVELRAGHPGGRVEVQDVELLAQLDVVLGLEGELGGLSDPLHLEVVLVLLADRRVGVGHVRDTAALDVEPGFRLGVLGLQGCDAVLEGLAFLYEAPALLVRQLALHGRGVLVAGAALVLELAEELPAAVEEADHEVGIGFHIAVGDVLLDRGQVFLDEAVIQHDGADDSPAGRGSARARQILGRPSRELETARSFPIPLRHENGDQSPRQRRLPHLHLHA